MSTATSIRLTVLLIWTVVALAGFGVARFYDLVVEGWPALAALLGIMIGGKTFERVKELGGHQNARLSTDGASYEGGA